LLLHSIFFRSLFFVSGVCISEQGRSEQYEVNEITFKIDGTTSKDVYRDLMQTVETPARFWTFLYNSVYKNIGSKPVYFDPVLFEGDIMRLRQYLRDNGYSHALVDTSLHFGIEIKGSILKFQSTRIRGRSLTR